MSQIIFGSSDRKNKALRPFAMIYQLYRYADKFIHRDRSGPSLSENMKAAKERAAFLEQLGVKTDQDESF